MINYQKVWANMDTDEKIAFRDRAIRAVQEIYPHYIVRPFEPGDADRFFVGNKQDNVRVKVVIPVEDLSTYTTRGRSATSADLSRQSYIIH